MINPNGRAGLHPRRGPVQSASSAPAQGSAPGLLPPARAASRSHAARSINISMPTRRATESGVLSVLASLLIAGTTDAEALPSICQPQNYSPPAPIHCEAAGAAGPNGSTGISNAGGPGGGGDQAVDELNYLFSANLVSSTSGVPAFYLGLNGGDGGQGGSSPTGFNGGSGGDGARASGGVSLRGVANIANSGSGAPGIIVEYRGGNGGNGGYGGADGGSGGLGADPYYNAGDEVILYATDIYGNGASTPWTIGVLGENAPALQLVTRGGNGGTAGTGATGAAPGGAGGSAAIVYVGTVAPGHVSYPLSLRAQTHGDNAPGLAVLQSPRDGNPSGAGGAGGANDIAVGGTGGTGGTP